MSHGAAPHPAGRPPLPVVLTGWIELGSDNNSSSMLRALDTGGMVWEGKDEYKSIDAALQDLEEGLAEWMEENG